MNKRMEKPVNNNPGIYKEFRFDVDNQKWKDTGRYRAVRRVIEDGRSKKEQAVFNSIEEAKAFRAGARKKEVDASGVHRLEATDPEQRYTFKALLEDWKALHYLQIEYTSRQMYDSRLPHLSPLKDLNVADITTATITRLVQYWASDECPKAKDRETFEKELDLLKVILNFYRKHSNHAYYIPIIPEHYKAADIAKKPKAPVRGLREEDLGRFLAELNSRYPQFYPVALLQLGLGLRIGEALGLCWEDLDLRRRLVIVQRNLGWNRETQELQPKKRKNARILEAVVPDSIAIILRELQESNKGESPYLFHRDGELVRRQQVSKAYNRILEDLGIHYVSGTHMLRKTSGTLARKLTRDVYAASKLLDHSSVSITEKYYQEQLDEDKVKVADALDKVLSRNLSRTPPFGANNPQNKKRFAPPVPLCPATVGVSNLTLIKSGS